MLASGNKILIIFIRQERFIMLLYFLCSAGALAAIFTELDAVDSKHPRSLPDCTGDQTANGCPYSGPLSQYLWDQTEEYRQYALNTSFVQGIKNGNLNPTAFGGYVVQDAIYLYEAQKSITIAAGRATNLQHRNFLAEAAANYTRYYEALFKSWFIGDASGIEVGPACKSYMEYERSVAGTMPSIYFILSMIPCAKLWPWLGEQTKTGNHGVYSNWHMYNFDPSHAGYKEMEAFVDTAEQSAAINRTEALNVYRRCMRGEFEFFASSV